jgi:Fic family protein
MKYDLLAKVYYSNRDNYEGIYRDRYDKGVKLDIMVNGFPAFYSDEIDIYKKLLEIERINSDINDLARALPNVALTQYANRCLIDEIILTNDIEGVYSTRKEIGAILNELEEKNRKNRFFGLVNKYMILNEGGSIPLNNCKDVRALYDELFLEEIKEEDPGDVPDGLLFRKGPVNVMDSRQKIVHKGMLPEEAIIDAMDKALHILNDDNKEIIVRTALFHYLFGYIHPFYEGNGRMSRFISSYMLGKALHPLTSYKLSYVIKENINQYYKAFKNCNDRHNRGDLTTFIFFFIETILKVCEQLREDLSERMSRLAELAQQLHKYSDDEEMQKLYYVLLQAALFSDSGIPTAGLLELAEVSRPTLLKRLNEIKRKGLLEVSTNGKVKFYKINIDKLD